MGTKGSKATQQTNQTQHYEADPRIQQSAYTTLDKANSAANQPFQMPTAPVAGFNPFQEQSFNQVLDMQGQFSPYAQAASQYWQNSAAPVTGQDVAQYYNPMADSVFANLREDQGKQWNDTTQKLTGAAGGVGASRIAVGQAELGRQQNLASGQIGAQLYQQALQAAQQQKQAQAAAGSGMLNVGNAQQGASTRDIAMLGQAGLQQQQQQQAQLNAPYQNKLAELAYPFQTAQYLAGITGGLAGALGGTTNGQSTTTYQPAQPSGLAQGLGLGMQGLGMFAGLGGVPGISSLFSGMGGGAGAAGMFLANRGGAVPYAEGGSVEEGSPSGIPQARGIIPTIQLPMSQGHSGPLVGGINLQHQKMPSDGGGSTSNAAAASKALGQLSGMSKGQGQGGGGEDDSYEPDSEADGGAVFPKHFYGRHLEDGGVSDGSDWGDWGDPTGGGISADMFRTPKAKDVSDYDGALKLSGIRSDSNFGPETAGQVAKEPTGFYDTPVSDSVFPKTPPGTPEERVAESPKYPQVWDGPMPKARDLAVVGRMEGGKQGYGTVVDAGPDPRTGLPRAALGQYGIMNTNLDQWGRDVVGRPVTRDEFLSNPQLQDRIAEAKLGELRAKHGPEGMARAWLAGEGGMNDASRQDINGTNPYGHAATYRKYAADLGGQGGSGVELSAAGRPRSPNDPNAVTEGYYSLPRSRMPYPDSTQRDWGQKLARSPWLSLVKAGAVTASTPGPFGVALAKGIGAGADQLQGERGQLRGEEALNQRAQALHTQAQQHFDQFNKTTPYQQGNLDRQAEALAQGRFQPYNYTDAEGKLRIGVFNQKDGTVVDSETGDPIKGAQGLTKPGGAGSGRGSDGGVFEWKRKAWLATHQGDEEGALRYANPSAANGKQLSEAEIRKFALSEAEKELQHSLTPYTSNTAREAAKEARAKSIMESFRKGEAPPPAVVPPAAKAPMTPEIEGALKFIQENPNHKDAAAVREKLKALGY